TDVEGLDLLPADFSYRHMDLVLDESGKPARRRRKGLAPLAGDYDLAGGECPPSISLVSESVFEAADALLVPVIPATLSSRTFDQLERVIGDDLQVLAFFSMVDGRKRLHREVIERMAGEHREVLRTAIPASADVERMGSRRTVLDEFA